MRLLSLVLLLSTALPAADCHSIPVLKDGQLELLVSDLTGQQHRDYQATLTSTVAPGAMTPLQSPKQKIPYGKYVLRIEASGFKAHEQTIEISAPQTELRVELELGSLGCGEPPSLIRGQIQNLPAKQEIWAKAVPLRGAGSVESRVHGSGYFELRGLRNTSYILILSTADRILHQQILFSQKPGPNAPITTIQLSP
jgi:hypothetical protein